MLGFSVSSITASQMNHLLVWKHYCDRGKHLQRVVKSAEKIRTTKDPHRSCRKASFIFKDPIQPRHGPLTFLPKGWRYRSVKSKTSTLRNCCLQQLQYKSIAVGSNCLSKFAHTLVLLLLLFYTAFMFLF